MSHRLCTVSGAHLQCACVHRTTVRERHSPAVSVNDLIFSGKMYYYLWLHSFEQRGIKAKIFTNKSIQWSQFICVWNLESIFCLDCSPLALLRSGTCLTPRPEVTWTRPGSSWPASWWPWVRVTESCSPSHCWIQGNMHRKLVKYKTWQIAICTGAEM